MTYTRYKHNRGRNVFRERRNVPSRGNPGHGKSRGRMKSFDPTQVILSSKKFENSAAIIPEESPTRSFADFAVAQQLKDNIISKGYETPTPIQDAVIPEILNGKDVIGIANTGTGKTAAFLIPLINKSLKDRRNKTLILAPTRELAVQIQGEFNGFAHGLGIYSALCIGGVSMGRQKNELRRKPSFVIGTPGRIKDLIKEKALRLDEFSSVVLDEADHMVDIGFIHDIKFIISYLPQTRQSLFFSATVDGKVKEVLQAFVKNAVTVSVKKQDTVINISQDVIHIESKEKKIDLLHDLLIKQGFEKVLIFGRTKWGVQKLSDELINRGFKAGAIHGNKNQNQRLRVLGDFKRNNIQILLATDVASRGLDINDVSHVINYDLPESYEDYIHRIGRTGRADKKGTALTFIEQY